jgi:hypothetical protein
LSVRLQQIDSRFTQWEDAHTGDHRIEAASRASEAVKAEQRMTKVESAISTRTWLGAAVTIIGTALGITIKPPSP